MKTSRIIFIWLVVFAIGSALGYFVGQRRSYHKAHIADESSYMERGSENLEFEARAYLRCLQDIDSGGITNLHDFALTDLRVYVSDVQQMQAAGYTWAPHISWLYSNATVYVAEHPRKEDDKTMPPNTALEPTAIVPSGLTKP